MKEREKERERLCELVSVFLHSDAGRVMSNEFRMQCVQSKDYNNATDMMWTRNLCKSDDSSIPREIIPGRYLHYE